MQRVDVTQDLTVPVDRAYAFLSEHENLGPLLGARVRRLRDGDSSRNGAGSVRELKIGALPSFEETVTAAEPDRSIDYRITRGTPLRNHHGRLEFVEQGAGSRVRWTIEFGAAPLLDVLVRAGLTWSLRRGLATLDAKA